MRRSNAWISLAALGLSCSGGEVPLAPADDTAEVETRELLRLRWIESHPDMGLEQALAGTYWALGSLGAALPASEAPIEVVDADVGEVWLTLDVAALGLEPAAEAAMWEAVAPVAASDEHELLGDVDLGRLLARTVYEPWHYYAITGACPDLTDWEAVRAPEEPLIFELSESALTGEERVISLPASDVEVPELRYKVGQADHVAREVVGLMANGRQRFAVYDEDGLLAPATPVEHPAGAPGRCMWCHEGRIMGTFAQDDSGEGLNTEEFLATIAAHQETLDAWRDGLDTHMDLAAEKEVHVWGELLVESFLHPTPARVAVEWGWSEAELTAFAEERGATFEEHTEYGDHGLVLVRSEVDGWMESHYDEIQAGSGGRLPPLDDFDVLEVVADSRVLDPSTAELVGGAHLVGDCGP